MPVPQALCVPSGSRVPQQSGAGGFHGGSWTKLRRLSGGDRCCLHGGGRKGFYWEMEPAGDSAAGPLSAGEGQWQCGPLCPVHRGSAALCAGLSKVQDPKEPQKLDLHQQGDFLWKDLWVVRGSPTGGGATPDSQGVHWLRVCVQRIEQVQRGVGEGLTLMPMASLVRGEDRGAVGFTPAVSGGSSSISHPPLCCLCP